MERRLCARGIAPLTTKRRSYRNAHTRMLAAEKFLRIEIDRPTDLVLLLGIENAGALAELARRQGSD
jgi:hypothetical protein